MAQFKGVEPYHWPGWFVAALAIMFAAVVVLTFSEPRQFGHIKGDINCKCWRGLKRSLNLQNAGWKSRWIVSFQE